MGRSSSSPAAPWTRYYATNCTPREASIDEDVYYCMRPSECRRYNPSRAEDRQGGFVLHNYAAWRMGDSEAAGLWSGHGCGG